MQIKVNEKQLELTPPLNLQQLLQHLDQSEQGIALAINQEIISRSRWTTRTLKEGDSVTLVKATAGG